MNLKLVSPCTSESDSDRFSTNLSSPDSDFKRRVRGADSQFDGFVPVDDVTRERERLETDDVNVAAFSADVQPLALERQVAVADSARTSQRRSVKLFHKN